MGQINKDSTTHIVTKIIIYILYIIYIICIIITVTYNYNYNYVTIIIIMGYILKISIFRLLNVLLSRATEVLAGAMVLFLT